MDQPATDADLRWWLDLAPRLSWTQARSRDHWYVVGGRQEAFSRADLDRLVLVIRTFGEPGRFWARTNLYLYDETRRFKWWCMLEGTPETYRAVLVNMTHADQVAGPQRDFDAEFLRLFVVPSS